MTTRIKLRRDTASNWAVNNPILALGEPGLETDSDMLKFGDGVTTWNNLNYSTGTPSQQEQFVLMIAENASEFPLVASSSFDGVNWISPQKVGAFGGSGQGAQAFYPYSVPALGNGKLVYIIQIYGSDDDINQGLAWADSIEQAPNRILDECTVFSSDQNQYPVFWNYVIFSGGYFVAVGGYTDYSGKDYPYFVYSQNGVNWTPGLIDQSYIATLVANNNSGGNDNATGMAITDSESNGEGWLLSLGWSYTDGGNTITPHYAGGFYISALSTQLNSSNYISTMPVTGYGYTGWLGSAWLGYDFATGVFSCTALDSPLLVGQPVTITGTFSSGSITGYTTGATYYVIGTPTKTEFQLAATLNGSAITTTASTGAITGLTITTLVKSATVWMLPPVISKPSHKALFLLSIHKYDITKKDISIPANKTEFTTLMPNAKTVPQIWIDGVYIGGLKALETFLK